MIFQKLTGYKYQILDFLQFDQEPILNLKNKYFHPYCR